MLSDQEREALAVIEWSLLTDDPSWTRAFDLEGQHVARQRRFELTFHVVAAVLTTVLSVLLFVANAPGPALFFAATTAFLCWLVRRLHRGDPSTSQDPGDGATGRAPV